MGMLRRLTALGLVLAIALAAVAVGRVRGETRAAGVLVICTGDGAVSVAVDGKGRPVGPPHLCPDCIRPLAAGLPAAPALPPCPDGATALAVPSPSGLPEGKARGAARARAPPLWS